MINLWFIFLNFIPVCLMDAWRMTKVMIPMWGYNSTGAGTYNADASDNGELSMFAFWYAYVIVLASILFSPLTALINIACIVWLHWTGSEDFGYYLALLLFKNPEKYEDTHVFVTVCGVQFPAELYWLGLPRKIGFITIPSILSFVCGKKVLGRKFVIFVILNIIFVIGLKFIEGV